MKLSCILWGAICCFSLRATYAEEVKGDITYYERALDEKLKKREGIYAFVVAQRDIKSVFDVGCNNGLMSFAFLSCGMKVLGTDIMPPDFKLVPAYQFRQADVMCDSFIYFNDCTLFLSLYHHVLGAKGLDFADALFYKLLLRTKYLIFDTGHVGQVASLDEAKGGWLGAQKDQFLTEKALFDHFNLPYKKICDWRSGAGTRDVVVFEKKDFDTAVEAVDIFRCLKGKQYYKDGLFSVAGCSCESHREDVAFDSRVVFYKLKLGDRCFFAINLLNQTDFHRRAILEKISNIYEKLPLKTSQPLPFYGISDAFGFVFAWPDDIKTADVLASLQHEGVLEVLIA